MGKIRLGIIGTGQRVYQHGDVVFKNCSDIAILAAVCDNKSDRLAHVKKEYGREFGYEANAYLDYREMLAKEKLDGVYIATPTTRIWMWRSRRSRPAPMCCARNPWKCPSPGPTK